MKYQSITLLLATAMLITSCSCSSSGSHYSESSLDPISSSEEPSSSVVSSSESSSSEESSSSSSSEELPDVDFNYYVDQVLVHTETYTRAQYETLTGDLWEYTSEPHFRGWYGAQWWFSDWSSVDSLQAAKNYFDESKNCVNLYGAPYTDDYAVLEYYDTLYSWGVTRYPSDCTLTNIVIPDSFNTQGFAWLGSRFGSAEQVFPSSTRTLTLTDTLQGFNDYAFKGLNNLTTLFLTHNPSYDTRVFLEDDILYFHGFSWSDNKALTTVKTGGEKNRVIAEQTAIINDYAFECCDLETIDLSGALEVRPGAFKDCKELTSITLTSSMQTVAAGSFIGCEKLETIYFHGDMKDFDSIIIKDDTLKSTNVVCC